MRKHFVKFFSPGTFVSEESSKPIDSWDIATAVEMANGIQERYGAKPYGFEFRTCIVLDPVDDGEGGKINVPQKEVERSGLHWLGGALKRFDEIPRTSETNILLDNMRCNEWPFIVENRNSYRHTMQFDEDACIVDADGSVIRRGNDPDIMEYRKQFKAERDEYYKQFA